MDAQADLHLCCLHMAKTGFFMTWLRLSLSRIEGQVHLKAILQDSEVVNLLAMLQTLSTDILFSN